VSPAPEQDRGAIAFGEKLLTVLAEGRFQATYKYAVLLGLMDLCLEHSTASGSAPRSIGTEELARKIVELYFPHTAPFGEAAPRVLMQNQHGGEKQAKIVTLIERFREEHAPDPSATLSRARRHDPPAYERLVREVEWVLALMPLPKLQRVGNRDVRFLYEIVWDDEVRRRDFTRSGFDRTIRFVGGAGDHLVRLAGLLRPFIQREWTRLVARINSDLVPESGLEEFLFGVSRSALTPIREDLRSVDAGRCFYCNRPLGSAWEVDHFVPWARYPNNGIENLVSADVGCNGYKLDHLAAAEHVEHWLERLDKQARDLASIAESRSWDRQPERSVSVARSIYLRLPSDAQLWRQGREFVDAERRRLVDAFASSAP
jgi:hypothetical protein